jgi:hypothetical protein
VGVRAVLHLGECCIWLSMGEDGVRHQWRFCLMWDLHSHWMCMSMQGRGEVGGSGPWQSNLSGGLEGESDVWDAMDLPCSIIDDPYFNEFPKSLLDNSPGQSRAYCPSFWQRRPACLLVTSMAGCSWSKVLPRGRHPPRRVTWWHVASFLPVCECREAIIYINQWKINTF